MRFVTSHRVRTNWWVGGGAARALAAILAAAATLAAPSLAAAFPCTGCTPLDDAGGPPYLGAYPLGLYAGGTNAPPPAHLALAMTASAGVVPRDASGAPDPDGLIGFIAIGMSNTNQEFATFERNEDPSALRNGRVIILDAAQGGQSAEIIMDPSVPYWGVVGDRVVAAGLDANQVQVAWLKEADGAVSVFTFPAHAETLENHLREIVRHLKDTFPMLQLCYVSSRIYGGYNSNPARSEPLSYETAFAFRSMIDAQASGDATLNADPGAGVVEAPVLLWGPYLWANGTTPRASDGLTWDAADYEGDFVHPAASGEAKVAALLSGFFTSDATATPWYLADTGTDIAIVDASADAYVRSQQPSTNFGADSRLEWYYNGARSYIRFDLSTVTDDVVHAKLSLKTLPGDVIREGEVVVVTNTTWGELTITAATAPPFDGAVLGAIPPASTGTAVSLDVTAAVQAAIAAAPPGTAKISLGIRATPGSAAVQAVGSRESSDTPRLVLTTTPSVTAVPASANEQGATAPRIALSVSPNPSPRGSNIALSLALAFDSPRVEVSIFDASGALVRKVYDGAAAEGSRGIVWDGRDARGRLVPSGRYFARAAAPDAAAGATAASAAERSATQQIIIVR